MIIEDSTGQAEIQNCSRIPDAWSTNEGKVLHTISSDIMNHQISKFDI
jgi:hypothetical protein